MREFPVEVVEGRLWLSDRPTAARICKEEGRGHAVWGESACEALRLGIRAVITTGWNAQQCNDGSAYGEGVLVLAGGLHGLKLAFDDASIVDLEIIRLACRFHELLGPTLVHCNAGGNRSPAVVACIAEACYGLPYERTYEIIGGPPGGTPEMRDLPARWRQDHYKQVAS